MLKHLVDLELPFESSTTRAYLPEVLIRYALSSSDYWAGLAMDWIDAGAAPAVLEPALLEFSRDPRRPQAMRHRAKRLCGRRSGSASE